MMARALQIVVLCAAILVPVAGYAQRANPAIPLVCDVTRFGAIANDANIDDTAIARVIGQCAHRGGQVLVPVGVFLTGGVELKSNMELHLAGGAILRGAPSLVQYRLLATNDNDRKRGVVVGINVPNVAITGQGTIDGAGKPFHTPNAERPDFSLGLFGCSNVSVRNVTLIDPSKYHVTANTCSNMVFDGITILADMLAPNSDGLQLRDTSDVRISNCRIETGDDAIVLKSGNRMIERISISNCALKSDDAAFKFGTGSEPGIRHVNVSNVTITGSRYGIALFMEDGGIYEDNRFSNMIIETGGRHAREYPIFVDIDTRQPDSPAGWGRIRGLSFDGIDIKTRGNRAHAPRTGAADYSSLSGQIVIGHARHVTVSNVSAIGVTAADQLPVLVTRDVKQLRVDGQAIAASVP